MEALRKDLIGQFAEFSSDFSIISIFKSNHQVYASRRERSIRAHTVHILRYFRNKWFPWLFFRVHFHHLLKGFDFRRSNDTFDGLKLKRTNLWMFEFNRKLGKVYFLHACAYRNATILILTKLKLENQRKLPIFNKKIVNFFLSMWNYPMQYK